MAAAGGNAQEWKRGSVCRVKLVNFLTYADAEFFPGPRLNVVIGPNGTGKSSIVCAILLGLGGAPQFLGRGDKPADFVKHGEDVAEIEVDLFLGEGEKPLRLRRRIAKASSSNAWYLNGHSSTKDAVKKAVLAVGVDTDSLCQFLPQDRVGEFSLLNPQDLLKQTLRTVCGPEKLQEQKDLSEKQAIVRENERTADALRTRIAQETEENAQLEKEVERMDLRAKHVENLRLGETRRYWLQFEEEQSQCKALRDGRAAKKAELAELEGMQRPAQKRFDDARVAEAAATERVRDGKIEVKRLETLLGNALKAMAKCDDAHADAGGDLNVLRLRAGEFEKNAKRLEKKVAEAQAAVDSAPDPAEAKAELARKQPEHRNLRDQVGRLDAEVKALLNQRRDSERELKTVQRQLENVGSARIQALRKWQQGANNARDTTRAMDWIHKQQWQGEVFGPVATELQIAEELHAQYVETHVPAWALSAIVFTNDDDRQRALAELVDRHKLKLNVTLVVPGQQQRPYGPDVMRQLQEFGIQGYMDQVLNGPAAVLHHLNVQAATHTCLVGDERTNQAFSRSDPGLLRLLGQQFCIFTPHGRLLAKSSRYGGAQSIQERQLSDARVLMATGNNDDAREAQALQERVAELHAAEQERTERGRRTQQQLGQLRQAEQVMSDERKELMAASRGQAGLENRLRKAQQALADFRSSGDQKEREREILKTMQSWVEKHIRNAAKAAEAAEGLVAIKTDVELANLARAVAAAERSAAELALNEQASSLRHVKKAVEEADALYKESKKRLGALYKDATANAPLQQCGNAMEVDDDAEGEGESKGAHDIPDCVCEGECENPVQTGLEAAWTQHNVPDSLRELAGFINQAEAARDAISVDSSVVARYQARKENIKRMQAQFDTMATSAQTAQEALDQEAEDWVSVVRMLAERTSQKVSAMFEELDCRGDVHLIDGDHVEPGQTESKVHTFNEWGLQIRVAFRDGVELSPLSGLVQSGGERSLSTIIFFLSLQSICLAPLRVVDEINQGMDEKWEREVYRLINQHVCSQVGPQLFLITPKLLQNLEYDENVAVHVVFNGHWLFPDPCAWDMARLAAAKRPGGDEDELRPSPKKRARS